ncbi:hypothetical protein HHI36_013166 [Cryptolaemus montrouzieri]|uniref:Uncharacterized protein n=1 Tax=Cryptolaemus montrouzieri TaxID=559131 RepID=A0ABD2NGU6_9CUCU
MDEIKVIRMKKAGFEVWNYQIKIFLESIQAWKRPTGEETKPAADPQKSDLARISCQISREVESLRWQIRAQGEELKDNMVFLTAAYSILSIAWESTPANEGKLNNLCSRLLKVEMKLKVKLESEVNGNQVCFKCGKRHVIKDCPVMKNVKCFKCNDCGHTQRSLLYTKSLKVLEDIQTVEKVVESTVDRKIVKVKMQKMTKAMNTTSEVVVDEIVDTENNEKHEYKNQCYVTEDVEKNLCKKFVFDSGSSNHMVGEKWVSFMHKTRKVEKPIKIKKSKER